MNKRILKITGWLAALSLLLGVGAVAGGGIVYAMRRANDNSLTLHFPKEAPLEPEPGIVIASVVADGPAEKAGVVRGDVLLNVNDETVNTVAELIHALGEHESGDTVTLTVLHGDEERTLDATLDEQNDRPYLGIVPCAGMPETERVIAFHIPKNGAMIVHVEADSPANLAGLQEGDVVVAVGEDELDEENSLADLIAAYEPGDTVTLQVKRADEESRDVTVELGEHPDKEGVAYLGVRYQQAPAIHVSRHTDVPFDLPPAVPFPPDRRHLHIIPEGGATQGVIVLGVDEDSPADTADLRNGDVITAIEGDPIQGPQDLSDAIADHRPGDEITLTVHRVGDKESHEVQVTLAEHPKEEETAYLGIKIGGFFRMEHLEGGDKSRDELDLFFQELEMPHDEFHLDVEPGDFEFDLPFEQLEVNCCGQDI